MSKKDFSGQFEDEEVLLVFRRHPIVMRKGFLVIAGCLLIGGLIGTYLSRDDVSTSELFAHFGLPLLVSLLVGLVGFLYYWIGWYYSVSIATDQRFLNVQQTGIFKKRSVNDINLSRILSVNYEVTGMWANLLGFGTIIIQTLVGDFVITYVPKPAERQAELVLAIKKSGVELDKEITDED